MRAGIVTALLAALAAQGAESRKLWEGPAVHLGAPSPDGSYIAGPDATGALTVRDTASGTVRVIAPAPAGSGEFAYFSVPSPDGTRIAYAWRNRNRFYDLRVVDVAGGTVRTLVENEELGFVQPCAWSPDGRSILTLFFRRDNISQITLVSAADGSIRVLRSLNWSYPNRMSMSPDGRWIAFDDFAREGANERDIFLLAADGTALEKVVEHRANDVFPLFSPDGTGLVFLSDRGGGPGLWLQSLAGSRAEGEPRLLHGAAGRALPMGITRDGTLYYALRTGEIDVYVSDWGSAEAARVSGKVRGANSNPQWAPDGSRLAYLARTGQENFGAESRVIVVRDLALGGEQVHAPKLAVIEWARWSPRADSLLLSGSDRHGQRGLFRYDLASGRMAALVREPAVDSVPMEGTWSADGKSVYFHREGALRSVNVETREERELVRAAELRHLGLSGSGRYLSYVAGSAVVVLPVESLEPRQVATLRQGAIDGLEWLPGEEALLLSAPTDPPSLWRIPAAGGAVSRIDWRLPRRGPPRLDPSGKRVAFARGELTTELRALSCRCVAQTARPPAAQ